MEIQGQANLEQHVEPRLLTQVVLRAQLLRLALKGLTATKAAEIVGCHASTARQHYADPSFRTQVLAKVNEAFEGIDESYIGKRKSLHEMLEVQAYESFTELVGMLQSDDLHPALRVKINQDFLDRVEDTAQVTKKASNVDATTLQRAAKAAREMDNVIEIRKAS